MQHDAAEHEELVGDKEVPGVDAISDDQGNHRSFGDPTAELLVKAPMSVSKLADLGKEVPSCGSRIDGEQGTKNTVFTRVRGLYKR